MTFHAAWTCETLLTPRTLVRLLSSVNYLVNLKAFFNPETLSTLFTCERFLYSMNSNVNLEFSFFLSKSFHSDGT